MSHRLSNKILRQKPKRLSPPVKTIQIIDQDHDVLRPVMRPLANGTKPRTLELWKATHEELLQARNDLNNRHLPQEFDNWPRNKAIRAELHAYFLNTLHAVDLQEQRQVEVANVDYSPFNINDASISPQCSIGNSGHKTNTSCTLGDFLIPQESLRRIIMSSNTLDYEDMLHTIHICKNIETLSPENVFSLVNDINSKRKINPAYKPFINENDVIVPVNIHKAELQDLQYACDALQAGYPAQKPDEDMVQTANDIKKKNKVTAYLFGASFVTAATSVIMKTSQPDSSPTENNSVLPSSGSIMMGLAFVAAFAACAITRKANELKDNLTTLTMKVPKQKSGTLELVKENMALRKYEMEQASSVVQPELN